MPLIRQLREMNPRSLGRVGPPVGSDFIVLTVLGALCSRPDEDCVVLEDRGRCPKEEVDVALDPARLVVLSKAVGIERVLVS